MKFTCNRCSKQMPVEDVPGHSCSDARAFDTDLIEGKLHFIVRDRFGNRAKITQDEANALMRDLHDWFHGDD